MLRASLPVLMLSMASGCFNNPDKFARESAEAICESNTRCAEKFTDFPVDDYDECIDVVEFDRQRCIDECRYFKNAARKCVGELRDGARWCSMERQNLAVCNEVFLCDDEDLEFQCGLAMPVNENCSVHPRGGTRGGLGLALGLVLLGFGAVRRRRGLAHHPVAGE